jgi:hypothetical protein
MHRPDTPTAACFGDVHFQVLAHAVLSPKAGVPKTCKSVKFSTSIFSQSQYISYIYYEYEKVIININAT